MEPVCIARHDMHFYNRRRFPRFDCSAGALLVFRDDNARQTLILTSFADISLGGACLFSPDRDLLAVGTPVRILSDAGHRRRDAMIVGMRGNRLHLEMARNQYLSEFELDHMLRRHDSPRCVPAFF